PTSGQLVEGHRIGGAEATFLSGATPFGTTGFFLRPAAPAEIYTLSLHDALPIWSPMRRTRGRAVRGAAASARGRPRETRPSRGADRKSTRLNSSHLGISYAVFCLKKKNQTPAASAASAPSRSALATARTSPSADR